jgi:hypothetical protein
MLLSPEETNGLLAKYKLPAVKSAHIAASDFGKLAGEAKKMQPPLVLKGVAEGVVHKSEAGFIALGITNESELKTAAENIAAAARKQSASLEGFILQEQAQGVELIIGGKRDPVFGPTVLFGSGGVLTELFRDVAIRVCPVRKEDALEMISETKASKFFAVEGFRGRRVDTGKVVEMLLATSKLLEENPRVMELDFNPVMAAGDNVLIADARIVTGD